MKTTDIDSTKADSTKADSTKAISFKLLPVTKTKLDRLQKISDNFKDIYNHAAMLLPSLQTVKQAKARSILNQWRKDLKSSTTIHSKIAEEAIEYARANYQTILTQGESRNPQLKEPIIRLHNQIWHFKEQDGTTYIVIPAEKIGTKYTLGTKYTPMWLPIKNSEYYTEIISKNKKWGAGQINLNSQTFTTSITVKRETSDYEYEPETHIGIDLGVNNLAVMVITDSNGKVLKTKFWSGTEIKHIRTQFYRYRNSVQKIGRMDCVRKTKGYERNWMKNVNHNISRDLIDIAKTYPCPIIQMENLHRFKRGRIQWNFYQLREMIRYKADLKGIKFSLINPANTSLMCPKCKHTDKLNRLNGTVKFECVTCHYKNNADFVGAYNISRAHEISQN